MSFIPKLPSSLGAPKHNADVIPIFSPRTSYKNIKKMDEQMIADMTLNFDRLTINLLKEEFAKKNNELTLIEFIVIAKRHLKFWQTEIINRDFAVLRYLTSLFVEIDINGNGDMEWEEFTNYIIEKATVLKNLKSKADEIKHYARSPIIPKTKTDTPIHKLEYVTDLDKVAYFQQGSDSISFMNVADGQVWTKKLSIEPKKLVVNISSVKKESGKLLIKNKDLVLPTKVRVLDMLYLADKKYRVLLVATSDCYVRAWRYSQNGFGIAVQPDNQDEPFQHLFTAEIYCMAWDSINQILYCGQKSGNIYMWNLKTDLEKALCDQETGDTGMVTSMITMPKLQFMATGRMDGKLILWDTINYNKKWVYTEHERGILTLAFNESMILLFSAGFDHKICIWNPYISTLIHKIEGHLSPVYSLKVIAGTHQLVSLDAQGIVKITDSRRFHIIYSFSVESGDNTAAASALVVIPKPLKLVFGGRFITMYQYDRNYNPQAADEHASLCCRYVKEKLCFFTPAGNKIKVWNALNGDVQKIYVDVTVNEVSTFEFDVLKKRMVIGDTKGNVTLHNTSNGARMKSLAKHAGEVTFLTAIQNESGVDIFISCGVDNDIKICKETEESYEIIRTISLRKDVTVNCLEYSQENKIVIVGTNIGTLAFYEIETGKTSGTCLNKPYEEFTSISLTGKPIIVATTSTGKIMLIAIPPLPNRFERIRTFVHLDCQKENTPLGVRLSCFNNTHQLLFVVDDKMYLTCYDLSEASRCLDDPSVSGRNPQSFRRKSISNLFDQLAMRKVWQLKAHNEVIRSLQYIPQESILVTTSFDKKIKLWKSVDGTYLDSLQQNYNRVQPTPIGYFDRKSQAIYSAEKKKVCRFEPPSPIDLQFDPFLFSQTLPNLRSNHEWNLTVDFKEVANAENSNYYQLQRRVSEVEQGQKSANSLLKKRSLNDIRQQFVQNRRILDELMSKPVGELAILPKRVTRENNPSEPSPRANRLSHSYFRRSISRAIKNTVEKGIQSLVMKEKQALKSEGKKLEPLIKNRNVSEPARSGPKIQKKPREAPPGHNFTLTQSRFGPSLNDKSHSQLRKSPRQRGLPFQAKSTDWQKDASNSGQDEPHIAFRDTQTSATRQRNRHSPVVVNSRQQEEATRRLFGLLLEVDKVSGKPQMVLDNMVYRVSPNRVLKRQNE